MKSRKKRSKNVFSSVVSFFTKDFGLKCLSLVLATAIYLALAPDTDGTDRFADSAKHVAEGIAESAGRPVRSANYAPDPQPAPETAARPAGQAAPVANAAPETETAEEEIKTAESEVGK